MRDIHEILYSCLVYLLLLLEFQFVDGIDMALPAATTWATSCTVAPRAMPALWASRPVNLSSCGNKNMAIVSCIEKTKKLSKSFNVAREDKENPFYFEKYVPKK